MTGTPLSTPVRWLLVATLALAIAALAIALLAARTLTQRNEAVRIGELQRLAGELAAELREAGPAEAAAVIARGCVDHRGALVGIELSTPGAILASCGSLERDAWETTVMLGAPLRPPGPGGWGAMRGRARARLRLQPDPALGRSPVPPWLVLAGAGVTATALVVLALGAAQGVRQSERLARSEAERQRLSDLALAGAGLAHRLRNPLGAIKGTAQLLADNPDEGVRTRAGRIVEASERIDGLLSTLLGFARPPSPHPEVVDLGEVSRTVASRCSGTVRVEGTALARADREHVVSILEELLANARATDVDGELLLTLHETRSGVEVAVHDRGTGLAVDPEQAFAPYVTTRPEGTGLGLPLVRALARANRGDVSLATRQGGGCTATLRLPRPGSA